MIVLFQLIFILYAFVQVSLYCHFYAILCASMCLVYWFFNASTFMVHELFITYTMLPLEYLHLIATAEYLSIVHSNLVIVVSRYRQFSLDNPTFFIHFILRSYDFR